MAWVLKWPREIGQVFWVDRFRVESKEGEVLDITTNTFYPQSQNFFLFSRYLVKSKFKSKVLELQE